jgi:Winged helix DNA-binding domain
LIEVADGTVDLAGREPAAPLPPPRLLGPFDPVLHGWVSRDFVVGDHPGIVTSNGLFRPIALVDGRSVATWGLDSGKITLRPFEPISQSVRRALVKDAADVLDYLGLELTAPEILDAR